MREEPKVLFIVGKGRSGSTILDTILGEAEGFFSTGELWRRWGERRLAAYPCGCGNELQRCPIWSPVLQRALERLSEDAGRPVTDADLLRWEMNVTRWFRIPRLLRASPKDHAWEELRWLGRFASLLYQGLAREVGARVIIDSSKWPANPGPLGLVPGIRSYVVHLVRDPRAVAYSWQRRRRFSEDGPLMPRFGPVHSALSWVARNVVAEAARRRVAGRSLRLRYEDLMDRPLVATRDILNLLDEGRTVLPFVDDHTVRLGPNHTVWGNPSRFERGRVELKEDREWVGELDRRSAAVTVGITAPLLLRYGYPLARN